MSWLPTRITQPVSGGVFTLIIILIWLQLIIGIVATTWTAFFYDDYQDTNCLAYVILSVAIAFSTLIFYFTGRSTWSRLKGDQNNSTVNWLTFGMTCVGTTALLGIVYRYNITETSHQRSGIEVAGLAIGTFVLSLFIVKLGVMMHIMVKDTGTDESSDENDSNKKYENLL